jgi:hypothetical protein
MHNMVRKHLNNEEAVMPNNVPNAPMGNEGQTDMDRGQTGTFTYSKEQRQTGRTGSVGMGENSNTVDGNKSVVNDPRTTSSS